jgi:flagellar motility protein MotE (MotC chaperone)
MADVANLDEVEDKKAKKERLKAEKKAKKEAKKRAKEDGYEDDEEEEKLGGKLVLALVTILIIVIWLAIIAVLIKSDVGGFGSSVLYPIFKDVPYINKILPSTNDAYVESEEDTQYRYGSIDEAVARIKELEQELDVANSSSKNSNETIEELRAEIEDLSTYKEEEAAFEAEKEKFYEEVVFSDEAPDINEYKTYYESIDPKNAEVLYKQVVEQITYDDQVEEYVKTYTQMQAKDAAAIFDTMTDDLSLVADILNNMGTKSRADILGKMDTDTAAKLTKIMEPTK